MKIRSCLKIEGFSAVICSETFHFHLHSRVLNLSSNDDDDGNDEVGVVGLCITDLTGIPVEKRGSQKWW